MKIESLEKAREHVENHTHIDKELARLMDVAFDELMMTPRCGEIVERIKSNAKDAPNIPNKDQPTAVREILMAVFAQRLFERVFTELHGLEQEKVIEEWLRATNEFIVCHCRLASMLAVGEMLSEMINQKSDDGTNS